MRQILHVGFWAGMLAFIFTATYIIVQLLQIMRVIPYPIDEILIYSSSLCIVIPFVLEMLALHYITSPIKRFWTHAALIFTTLYAIFVTSNYVVQLATVLPMKLTGKEHEIKILDQTPHSVFWNFDALGYICMGISMFFAAKALDKSTDHKFAKAALTGNALITPIITFIYFYPGYSERLLLLGLSWAIMAPLSMIALALLFKKYVPENKLAEDARLHVEEN